MKVARVLLMILALCLYCSAVGASEVFEATSTEQGDMKPSTKSIKAPRMCSKQIPLNRMI